MSGNEAIPLTYVELAVVLRDMAALVEVGDSFEGSIEYLMPPIPDWAHRGDPKPEGWEDPEVLVRASYRIGNSMGQGGVRIIGTMGGRPG